MINLLKIPLDTTTLILRELNNLDDLCGLDKLQKLYALRFVNCFKANDFNIFNKN